MLILLNTFFFVNKIIQIFVVSHKGWMRMNFICCRRYLDMEMKLCHTLGIGVLLLLNSTTYFLTIHLDLYKK